MSETPSKFGIVMIIDDNNIDLYITSRVIHKNSVAAEVLEFSSGGAALQYLKENKDSLERIPEIILVDIYMPQMSGFEFMEAFDALPQDIKSHSQCYIISSSIDEQDIERTIADKNVVAFMEKPVDISFLQNIPKL